MRTKTFSAKKLLSLLLTVAMFATMILPTSVFAADITVDYAYVCMTEIENGAQKPQLRLVFSGNVSLADDWANMMTVTGKDDWMGSGAITEVESNKIYVDLGTGYTLASGDIVDFGGAITPSDSLDTLVDASATLTGGFDLTTVKVGSITPSDATVTLSKNGYVYTLPAEVGLGNYSVKIEKDGYITKTYPLTIASSYIGGVHELNDELVKLADFTALNAALTDAATANTDNCTVDSISAFNTALAAANAINQNTTTEADQAVVDAAATALSDAISGLTQLANFAAYDNAIAAVNALVRTNYTTGSLNALDAVVTANAIDKTNEADQTKVDNAANAITTAIANLVETRVVEFTAVAVASDVNANYAKADEVYLVFSEAIQGSPNLIADLKVGGESASAYLADAGWVDNTIYKMNIIGDINDAAIEFVGNDNILAVAGHALKGYATTIVGNLDEVYELVTATKMTATIIDNHAEPYMVNGDKIVLVFNAPVYGTPATITVSGMEFAVVADTNNTVYSRVLDFDSVVAGQQLTFVDDTNRGISATLKGSFGGAVVPAVIRALVEDVDGTAKTAGDKITIFFNVATNKEADTTETNFAGVLAGATGKWLDNQTLVITLGDTTIKTTDKIDISNLGIKDFYGVEDAENVSAIKLEGSFGVAVQPTLLTLTAISKYGTGAPSAGDEIHLAFNVKMKEEAIDISDFTFQYGDYGSATADVTPNARWAGYDDYSVIIITLGKEATVVPGTTKITINKDLYEESGSKICANVVNRTINGTFGTSIAPTLINATIVKRVTEVGSQPGDQIVLLFNVPTNHADIINLISVPNGSLGNYVEEGDWTNNNTIYTITLGNGASIENGSKITFTNTNGELKDINGQKSAATKTIDLIGSFGTEADEVGISPTSVTATIVKTTAVAGAQEEDQIVFAFNVATNGVDLVPYFKDLDIFGDEPKGVWSNGNTIYTLILGNGATVTDGTKISFTDDAGIKDANGINDAVKLNNISLVGSFGKEVKPVTVAPTLLDAVIIKGSNTVGATKGDKIQFIFNMAINDADLYKELGGVNVFGAESNGAKDNNIYTITIGNNANIPASFNITAAAGLKDAAEFSEAALIPNIVLTGSFGNEIKPVTAAPTLFKAVIVKATDTVGPQAGDKIQLVFNMAINGADLFATLGGEAVFGSGSYGSADSNVYTITLGTGITSIPTTFSINSDAGLKDASGYSANAVIPNFTLVGSFGIVVNPVATKPALKNAVIIKDSGMLGIHAGDKIVLIFNVATNGKDDNIKLLNNIDFPGRNDETLGLNPTGRWISDIEYEITLGEGAAISEVVNNNAIIKFNHHNALMDKAKITAASEIEVYKFEGSFGVAPELTLEKAIIVKGENNTVAKAQKGDMIILSFSSKTNAADIKAKLGTEYGKDEHGTPNASGSWSNDDTVYTITLGDNPTIADAANFSIPENTGLTGIDGGALKVDKVTLEGSFGKVIAIEVVEAFAYCDADKDYIDIFFNVDTNAYTEDKGLAKFLFDKYTREVFGDYKTNWNKGKNILTVELGANHEFGTGSKIKFTGVITDADGFGALPEGKEIEKVSGEFRVPYVTCVEASYTDGKEKLTITFSTKTNMPEVDLSNQKDLGKNATGEWKDSRTLVVTLGEGRTISAQGTGGIILNGLGITSGLCDSKEVKEVVGTYSISKGELSPADAITIVDARVNATKDGDKMTILFSAATNMYGKILDTEFDLSEISNYIKVDNASFGENAKAKWITPSKLEIKIDSATHTFRNGDELVEGAAITFEGLKYANGLSSVKPEAKVIEGSFDGRETRITSIAAKKVNNFTEVEINLNKQCMDYSQKAYITFVVWNADKTLVKTVNSVAIDMTAVKDIQVSTKFVETDYSKVDVYVTDAAIETLDETSNLKLLATSKEVAKEDVK